MHFWRNANPNGNITKRRRRNTKNAGTISKSRFPHSPQETSTLLTESSVPCQARMAIRPRDE